MITPVLIQIVFWVGTAICLFAGVRLVVASFEAYDDMGSRKWISDEDGELRPPPGKIKSIESGSRTRFSVGTFVYGLAVMLFGPLLLRVYCELAMIFFKIHDELKELNNRGVRTRR